MTKRGEWVALALVALGGCAESHALCDGPELDREYRIEIFAVNPSDECPRHLPIQVLPGADWCEWDAECDEVPTLRCYPEPNAYGIVEVEARIDLDWSADESEGGADVAWLDASGAEVCSGAYDVTMRAL